MTLTAEQQELRRTRITASDIAAIAGLNPRRNAINVFLEKIGKADPFTGNEFTHWGNKLEAVIAEEYADRMKVSIRQSDTIVHPDYDWAAATPDRIVTPPESFRHLGDYGLECKNRNAYNAHEWGEPGSDEIPDDVAVQCHFGMEVLGMDRWDAAVLLGGNKLGIYTLERDDEVIEYLLELAHDFWHNYVIPHQIPDLDGLPASVDYLNQKWKRHVQVVVAATPEIAGVAGELREAKAALKEQEKEKARLENLIKDHIAEYAGVKLPDGKKITWKRGKAKKKTDWKTVAQVLAQNVPDEEFENLVDEHTTENEGNRTFLTPRNW